MTYKHCAELIRCDYHRMRAIGRSKIRIIMSPTFVLLFWYRVCYFMRINHYSHIVLLLPELFLKLAQHYLGIQFSSLTKIGGGVHFPHYSCIVIAGSTIIGNNCTIHQGVTLGRSFRGKNKGCPIIGDNVIVFPGAKIIGRVNIGDNAIVGANAVVLSDVPNNAVVVGSPAKIVSNDSSQCIDGEWRHYFYC